MASSIYYGGSAGTGTIKKKIVFDRCEAVTLKY